MNSNVPRTILLVGLFAILAEAVPAWAQGDYKCKGADSAQWSAAPSTISINIGSAGGLGVSLTSPMCLNTYPNFPDTLPVYSDVGLDSAVCPDGSSGSGVTCTLMAPVASISTNPHTYTDFGQTQTYNVHFDAANATAGTYSFHVHANSSDPDQTHLNGNVLNGASAGAMAVE